MFGIPRLSSLNKELRVPRHRKCVYVRVDFVLLAYVVCVICWNYGDLGDYFVYICVLNYAGISRTRKK